jgi:hypothetical protein
MAETQRKDSREQDAEKAQEKKRRLEPAPVPTKVLDGESISFPGLLGVSAMEPPLEGHAAFLGDPRFSHSANNTQKAGLVTELQQNYGNAYVQKVVGLIQAKKDESAPEEEPEFAGIVQRIAEEKGSGQPLEPKARSEMEAAFNRDFSGVRIHTDVIADKLSKELDAEAFTSGKDIFFKKGTYAPQQSQGKELLAHELTHTMQQGIARSESAPIGQRNNSLEQQAIKLGQAVSEGHRVSVQTLSALPRLQQAKPSAGTEKKAPSPPSPGAYLLRAGENPANVIDDIAEISKEAIAQRITTTQAAIKNFETNILLKSDDPQGDVLSVIIYNLFVFVIKDGIDTITAAIPAARAVGMAKNIAETFLTYSAQVKAAKGKDALRKFILNFRTVTIQNLLNKKKDLVLDLEPGLKKKFDEYAEGSLTPYKRTQKEPWVEGPQAWFLHREENRAKKALASIKPIPAVETQILQDWIKGSTERIKGGRMSPFTEELRNGYLDIAYFISRDWYGTKEGEPPKRVKEAKLHDAFLRCPSSAEVLKRLKEVMMTWNVWDIKVPKRVVIIETPVYPEADAYLEFDVDNKVIQKKDKYKAWWAVFKIPIPKDKVKAG